MEEKKHIIGCFAQNEQSAETRDLFNTWLLSETDSEMKGEALQQLWDATDSNSLNTEESLIQAKKRIFGARRRVRSANFLRWAAAAAVVLPLVTIGITAKYVDDVRTETADWRQVSVPLGERSELILADGTRLSLGAGTRVTYPASFAGKERRIFVDGEVYAQVAHDSRHPFIISADDSQVRVLGTTFGLRAYSTDEEVELLLVEGSVKLSIDGAKYRGELLLKPSEMASYNRRLGRVDLTTVGAEDGHGWAQNGSIYFSDKPLGEITRQLSRRFGRQIIIDKELEDMRFYVFLTETQSLDEVLDIFKMNKNITINDTNEIIFIHKNY